MELLRLHEAAQLVGVSYPTLKQWIYNGKIKSVKTAGRRHRSDGYQGVV
jgi:excisionase family DNA binding protein